MAKLELLWDVELPFFKMLFNNGNFSVLEFKKLHDFLKNIWLTDEDLDTYTQLKKMDISTIDREKVKMYNDKIRELFITKKFFIISTINKTADFNDFISQLNIKLSVDRNRIRFVRPSKQSSVWDWRTRRRSAKRVRSSNKKGPPSGSFLYRWPHGELNSDLKLEKLPS